MKNIVKYIIAVGTLLNVLSSCEMDLFPSSAIPYDSEKPLFLTENDVQAFQNGVMASYRALQYGSFTTSTELMFDAFNATIGYGNNYGGLHRLDESFTSSDTYVDGIWASHYAAIKNYNIVIDNTDSVSEEIKQSATILKGIAAFCRASSYLYLARHWGKAYDPATAATDLCVPLVIHYNQLEKPARATVQQVYDQIKNDLLTATSILVDVPGEVKSQIPTIDAVKALWARYYLDVRNYEEAAFNATEVIKSSAGYALANSAKLFDTEFTYDDGSEPIIQLFASPTEGAVGNTIYAGVGKNDDGRYFSSLYIPSSVLLNAYEANDLRRVKWFKTTESQAADGSQQYPLFLNGNRIAGVTLFTKYIDNPGLHTGTMETGAHAAKPLLISEMYLIAAEAYASGDSPNPAKAKEYLNQLQIARRATPTEGTMADVKKEWFRETVGEGLRMSCLKRWGDGFNQRPAQSGVDNIIQKDNNGSYTDKVLAADAHVFCWPIPAYERKINKNLVPNPGYGE